MMSGLVVNWMTDVGFFCCARTVALSVNSPTRFIMCLTQQYVLYLGSREVASRRKKNIIRMKNM